VNEASIRQLWRELKNHSDNEVESVLHIFKWLEAHLDEGAKTKHINQ